MTVLYVLLALLLYILFAPLRYAVWVKKDERFNARIRVSWGFALFVLRITVADGQTDTVLRIAGFRVRTGLKAGRKDTARKPKASRKRARSQADRRKETPSKTFTERIREIVTLLTEVDLKSIIDQLGRALSRVLRAALPKVLRADATVGFSDPAVTGWLYGAYEALANGLRLRRRVRLTADFTRPVFTVNGTARGRFCAAELLAPLLRFIASRPVRGLIKRQLGAGVRMRGLFSKTATERGRRPWPTV